MSEISSNSTTDSSTDVPRTNEAPPVLAQNDSNSAESSSSGSPRPTQDTRRKRRRIMEEETLESTSSEDENYQRLESELRRELADNTGENRPLVRTESHVDEVLVNADSERDPDASSDVIEILGGSNSNSDLENEAKSQQVVEISDDEAVASPRPQHKRALDYKCPICFEPPEAALVTPCGHVFCTECLFQMVNSSRGQSRAGHCALCRRGVHFRDVRLIILRKKRVRKT